MGKEAPNVSGKILGLFTRPVPDPDAEYVPFKREWHESVEVTKDGLGFASTEWHRSKRALLIEPNLDKGERAVLFQSIENLEELKTQFPQHRTDFELKDKEANFGENVCMSGMNVDSVCIGDIYQVKRNGKLINLLFKVTSPRRPCGKVDITHAKDHSADGVRHVSAANGTAGWFMRVISASNNTTKEGGGYCFDADAVLCIGDEIQLIERPCPQWQLRRIASLIYGKADFKAGEFPFNGTRQELENVCNLKELAMLEWKDKAIANKEKQNYRDKMAFLVVTGVITLIAIAWARAQQ
eukprot:m.29855 g.29855  ORF g.29855 m.29855 type:complete len:297 (-) comp8143_c0_seq1:94-984(-)